MTKYTLTVAALTGLLIGSFTAYNVSEAQGPRRGGDRFAEMWDAPQPGGPGGGYFGGPDGPPRPHGPGGPGFGGPGLPGLDGPLAKAGKLAFPFWENDQIAEDLELTDEQIEALEESHEIMKEGLEASKGSMIDLGKQLKEEMEKDSPNAATVNDLLDQITAEGNEKARLLLGHVVVVKNVLTEEQEEALPDAAKAVFREHRDDLSELRRDIRETLRDGGTIDDVAAVIDSYELPEPLGDIALKMTERILEHRNNRPDDERPRFGRGEQKGDNQKGAEQERRPLRRNR